MGKKRKAKQARAAERTSDAKLGDKRTRAKMTGTPRWVVRPRPAPAPASPAWLFGVEMAWAKLVAFRFVLFGVFATDAVLQISHAPRYGAGDFNVPHIPGLDSGDHTLFLVSQLVIAFVLALAAVGVGNRIGLPFVTLLYGFVYFGSQLDSYQHHYLVWLVLLLCSCQQWQRPLGVPVPPPHTAVRAWPVRVLLVQLGIVYLWAAISKLDAAWLDGRTLSLQLQGGLRALVEKTVGIPLAAKLTVATELVLAVAVWVPRAWIVALPLGVAFHIGIIKSDLEIGLFAYQMLAFYLLLVPDRVFVVLGRLAGYVAGAVRRVAPRGWGRWLVGSAGVALALALAWDGRIPRTFAVALAVTIAALIPMLWGGAAWHMRAGLALAFASLLVFVADLASDTAPDYYRFWGGTTRRLGDLETSERAYRRLTELAPNDPRGHYQLGKMLLDRGDESGLEHLRITQRLEPDRARAYVEEAKWLRAQGRTGEALEKAKEGTYAEPNNRQAQALVDALGGKRGAAPPDSPSPPDTDEQ